MKAIYKVCTAVTRVLAYVDIVAISIMVLLVFADVILRKCFSISIVGVTEITQMLWICMVLGWGESVYGPDNLKIDVVVNAFPKKAQDIIDSVITVFMIAVCVIVAKQVFSNAASNAASGINFSLLKFPQYPFVAIIGVGFLGGAAGLLGKAALHIAAAAGQEWPKDILGGKEG